MATMEGDVVSAVLARLRDLVERSSATESLAVPYGDKLRAKQVGEMIEKGRTTLWEMVKSGRFPQPFRHGSRFTYWPRAVVQAWIAEHDLTPRRHPRVMLRPRQVSQALGRSRKWLWDAVRRGEFPPPERRNSRCILWPQEVVDSYKATHPLKQRRKPDIPPLVVSQIAVDKRTDRSDRAWAMGRVMRHWERKVV